MKERALLLTLIFCFSMILPGIAPRAGAQGDQFYKGKTIRIMVGSTAGGFYDRWGRLFGKYMGKYIPGQPEFIVQNMTGAGSVIATNHVYNVAKPDGLTLVMPLNGVYIDQFAGRKEVQFDMRKFRFIGTPVTESIVFYMRADAPYKSIADIIKAKEPPKCGGSGTASSDYILSKVLEETVGAKFNTVLGYAGGTEIDLAVEKNEVVCRAHSMSAHFGREPFDTWHKRGFDRHLVYTSNKKDSACHRRADAQRTLRSIQGAGQQPPSRAGAFGRGRFRPADDGDAGHPARSSQDAERRLRQNLERSRSDRGSKKGPYGYRPSHR